MNLPDPEPLAWLLPILERKREDGSLYYSNEDVAAFLPVMLLTLGLPEEALPPRIAQVVVDFAAAAGVTPGMSKADAQARMQAYVAKNPLNPELVFEFRRGLREEVGGSSHEDLGRRITRALGTGQPPGAITAMLERRAPPPAGAVRGGPLARFAADSLLKK
ncbi:MAG: hypothetical protein IT384_04895 [Deltaproteobacteria bacterium]|nr:hypothetical protein [Deltaproteobacteria bacterium]